MKDKKEKPPKEWTLMFFFASDNNLSASMFYQLKSMKTAGFQEDTNVLAHFDPHERGMPSMIFEINRMEKQGPIKTKIGDDKNPTIRDLAGDQVVPAITDCSGSKFLSECDALPAERALEEFLDFAREHYPAKHYMLFLVGHGMIVGRDAFLPDDNPDSGISLVELGRLLRTFSDEIREKEGTLELVGMHSCSMSAIEVAYQLKGAANYMIASEGLSFVGAWPYRQLLQKIFCTIDYATKKRPVNIANLVKTVHQLCLHNGADFIFAGYSSDLCLISLKQERVEALNGPIERLTRALKAGLIDKRDRDLIVLAHWESQSFYQEVYTDLRDFCERLKERCKGSKRPAQRSMATSCAAVINLLKDGSKGPVVQADFSGPDCQFTHGLSIYFPWARPVEDAREHVIKNYRNYAFVTELSGASWLQFLNEYFVKTRRDPEKVKLDTDAEKEAWKFANAAFKPFGFQSGPSAFQSGALTGKDSPADAGGDFTYSYIKNYPRGFAISKRALRVFKHAKGRKKETK